MSVRVVVEPAERRPQPLLVMSLRGTEILVLAVPAPTLATVSARVVYRTLGVSDPVAR